MKLRVLHRAEKRYVVQHKTLFGWQDTEAHKCAVEYETEREAVDAMERIKRANEFVPTVVAEARTAE